MGRVSIITEAQLRRLCVAGDVLVALLMVGELATEIAAVRGAVGGAIPAGLWVAWAMQATAPIFLCVCAALIGFEARRGAVLAANCILTLYLLSHQVTASLVTIGGVPLAVAAALPVGLIAVAHTLLLWRLGPPTRAKT